mmetsp:Transcript_6568/g.16734  ORF Transcript_6568/g.16734 Transcript_6568/m.16734 type:complete len:296 (+) Transcript_6568:335-1222(+)
MSRRADRCRGRPRRWRRKRRGLVRGEGMPRLVHKRRLPADGRRGPLEPQLLVLAHLAHLALQVREKAASRGERGLVVSVLVRAGRGGHAPVFRRVLGPHPLGAHVEGEHLGPPVCRQRLAPAALAQQLVQAQPARADLHLRTRAWRAGRHRAAVGKKVRRRPVAGQAQGGPRHHHRDRAGAPTWPCGGRAAGVVGTGRLPRTGRGRGVAGQAALEARRAGWSQTTRPTKVVRRRLRPALLRAQERSGARPGPRPIGVQSANPVEGRAELGIAGPAGHPLVFEDGLGADPAVRVGV